MLSRIKPVFSNYLHRYSIAKTHQLLLGLDDDLLERASISRDLLQRGVDYWPWQIEEATNVGSDTQSEKTQELKSVTTDVSVTTGITGVENVAFTADSLIDADKAA